MTENKQFKLKIIGDINDVDSEIILKDGGQPLCEFISIEDARLVRDLLNALHEENSLLKDIITDIVVQLDANHTSNTYQMIIPINRVIFNELNRRLTETSFNEELRRFLDD